MLKNKIVATGLCCLLLLTGCKSLAPGEGPKTIAEEVVLDKNEPEIKEDEEFNINNVAESTKLNIVHIGEVAANNGFPKPNTLISSQPKQSVVVIDVTGNKFVRDGLVEITGKAGDERIVFDEHQVSFKDKNYIIMVFPGLIEEKSLFDYNFDVSIIDDKGFDHRFDKKLTKAEYDTPGHSKGILINDYNAIEYTESKEGFTVSFNFGIHTYTDKFDTKPTIKLSNGKALESVHLINYKDEIVEEMSKPGTYKLQGKFSATLEEIKNLEFEIIIGDARFPYKLDVD